MTRVAIVLTFAAMGCSSSDSSNAPPDTCAPACRQSLSCGQTPDMATCSAECHGLHFSDKCIEALASASCDELAKGFDQSSVAPVCFASCSTAGQTCIGNGHAEICSSGRLIMADCSYVCSTKGYRYSGVCGKTYNSQTSTQDVCWCNQ